ncbi:hypothetical protein CK232_04490 [Mesorhizobium sp. WSM4304]|nr:hypothetical protein CK232_04490 [Mesorhizobium sp. WSM4304]
MHRRHCLRDLFLNQADQHWLAVRKIQIEHVVDLLSQKFGAQPIAALGSDRVKCLQECQHDVVLLADFRLARRC